jgi:hypothetical protein
MVSGTVHATPSFETSALVMALATYRVLARSAPGSVQPAAGDPVAAGAVPVTAVPGLDEQADVLAVVLLLVQPPIRPAAIRAAAPVTTHRRYSPGRTGRCRPDHKGAAFAFDACIRMPPVARVPLD